MVRWERVRPQNSNPSCRAPSTSATCPDPRLHLRFRGLIKSTTYRPESVHIAGSRCRHRFFFNNWRPDTGTGLSAPPGHATEQRSWKSMTVTLYFNCISMPGWMQSGKTMHKTHLVGGGTLVAQGISRVVCALPLHDEVVADADGGPEVHQVVPCRRRTTLSTLAMLEVTVVDVPDAVRIVEGRWPWQCIHRFNSVHKRRLCRRDEHIRRRASNGLRVRAAEAKRSKMSHAHL